MRDSIKRGCWLAGFGSLPFPKKRESGGWPLVSFWQRGSELLLVGGEVSGLSFGSKGKGNQGLPG